jgi:hypothetical protein
MKHPASARKNSSGKGSSTRYESSLERNKIYLVLPDAAAQRDGDIRVVDESGDDYLFAADRFMTIDLPAAVKASLLRAF